MITYSPEDLLVLIAGVIPITGYTDGTFVTIRKDTNSFTTSTSTDGIQSRLYSNSTSYTVILVLSSVSASNDLLTKLHLIDNFTQRGKFPLLIKDLNGSSLLAATTCWIEQVPEVTFSDAISSRTWTLRVNNAVLNIGGNEDPTGLIGDLFNGALLSLPSVQGIANG